MDDTRIEEANPEKETGQIIRIDQEYLVDTENLHFFL